jgi:Ser/Thr protein kinase RdoA (MazF antagonist)
VRVVHQRVNTSVFADLETLMGNVVRVTTNLGARAATPRHAVHLRPAADGRPYVLDAAGAPWRTLDFIEGARTVARFDGPARAAEAAATAATLVAHLADLTPALPEVIPAFHDIPRRLDVLAEAAQADTAGRAGDCRAEVDAILARAGVAHEVAAARADGRLPDRTVHNDAKAENLLFDEATGAGLCLVDLDTVGTGTVLFDVGDLVRSGAARLPEDGSAVQGDAVDHEVAGAILAAYARAGAGFLTTTEVELLPLAGPLMALEAAARFLTDHLQGDVYFRIDGPGHNLRRARNQLRLFDELAPA